MAVRMIRALVLVTMAIAAPPVLAQGKGPATLTVERAEPGAIVSVSGIRHGRAAADGTKTVTTLDPGRHTVVIRQVGFEDSEHAVTLVAGRTVTVRPRRVPVRDAARLAFQRGEALALEGKHAQAIPELRDAIDLREGAYVEAQIWLARSLFALKRVDEAHSTIVGVVNANPKHAGARTVYANLLRERALFEEAAAEYRQALELASGRSPEAHTGLGLALQEMGRADEAIEELQTGIEQNDDAEPILYQLLGNALEAAGRREEAVMAYERFLELAPGHSLAPAVASLLERLREEATNPEEGDGNPFARPEGADYRPADPPRRP